MLSLPELRLGDRIIRLPLSPLGTVDVANAWLTADAGERHSLWLALVQRESGLALWGALRLPPDQTATSEGETTSIQAVVEPIAQVCDQELLRAYLRPAATVTSSHPEWERQAVEASTALSSTAACRPRDESTADGPAISPVSLTALARALNGNSATRSQDTEDSSASRPATGPSAEAFQRTLETEKLAALREFAYGLSHEINNPLANIATRAQSLLWDERDSERRRSLSVMAQQAMRAHTMIADLMLFAKPPALRRAATRPRQIVERLASELRESATQQGTRLIVPWLADSADSGSEPKPPQHDHLLIGHDSASSDCWILADSEQLLVALRAIATNALEALHAGGQIEFFVTRVNSTLTSFSSLSSSAAADAASTTSDCIRFHVRDSGPGITLAVRRHLFDPYYSGREAGRGLGVGLCKAWRIATDHGGVIEAVDAPGGGAEFRLDIPIIPADAPAHT